MSHSCEATTGKGTPCRGPYTRLHEPTGRWWCLTHWPEEETRRRRRGRATKATLAAKVFDLTARIAMRALREEPMNHADADRLREALSRANEAGCDLPPALRISW